MTGPRVSIIVPAFNAERYIAATLDSILAQDYANIEVIVVDDGSTDGTRQCVQAYGDRVRYLHQQNSGGAARPRNAGLRLSTGAFLIFIDADDLLAPGRIAREAALLAAHPSVALVFSDYQEFDESGSRDMTHFAGCPQLTARLRERPAGAELLIDPATSSDWLLTENFGHSSPMVRRECAEAVGGYDETTIPSEDFYFTYCVASRFTIAVLPTLGWRKRDHPQNLSANVPRVLHRKVAVRRRILATQTLPTRRRKLRRMIARYHHALAYYYTGRDNALAFHHVLRSHWLNPWQGPRLVGRLVCDLLGRNTLNQPGRRSVARHV